MNNKKNITDDKKKKSKMQKFNKVLTISLLVIMLLSTVLTSMAMMF